MNSLELLSVLVQSGKSKDVIEKVKELIDEGITANDILNNGLLLGMNEIGVKWKNGKAFIPEVLIAARALNAGMDVLKLAFVSDNNTSQTVVLGTVKGDMHDIGKNLVGMMLKSKGLRVIDLGTNVDAQTFVAAVKEHKAKFVCMSALLTTTMLYFKNVVEAFVDAGLRNEVVILCGGAPVTSEFSESVGCDYYSNDAVACAELIDSLVKEIA